MGTAKPCRAWAWMQRTMREMVTPVSFAPTFRMSSKRYTVTVAKATSMTRRWMRASDATHATSVVEQDCSQVNRYTLEPERHRSKGKTQRKRSCAIRRGEERRQLSLTKRFALALRTRDRHNG